ncbi:CarD family transcriptional regulator [Alloiococcus sp. CFN-8]|uniref:CarD family transcriptional regulator n=1 Tax=Alloiococcus sp. CFN-8 TaxID=3416081 RepID=UPI003CE9837A
MFIVGDKIVYPMQGAGTVEAIEEREFSGEVQKYYIVLITHNKLKIMIPESKIQSSHLRRISDEDTLISILQKVNSSDLSLAEFPSLKERTEFLNSKIKSGSLRENAEVVLALTSINITKKLNSTEKQILDKARKLVEGEVCLIRDISQLQAAMLIKNSLH